MLSTLRNLKLKQYHKLKENYKKVDNSTSNTSEVKGNWACSIASVIKDSALFFLLKAEIYAPSFWILLCIPQR